jgi:oligogalacturonide lyase
VTKLCNHAGHHHHLYFTNPGWYDNGNKLVIAGDRMNCANLFGVDLRSGEITQLTDIKDRAEYGYVLSCLNPACTEAYYWHDKKLWALSLVTLEERLLWTIPKGRDPNGGGLNVTADGKYVMFTSTEDLSDRIKTDFLHGYVGMEEYWAAKPLCHVIRIPVAGGSAEILHSENTWLGHMNTSPTQPAHLTFCHEGPWDKVDNRIWAMDISTCKVWPLRQGEKQSVGHEYWLADGKRVGYQRYAENKIFLGSVKFDGSDIVEHEFPYHSWHVHSNDASLIVGDGSPGDGLNPASGNILLWKQNENGYDRTRILCNHRCSMHIQQTHVHPRLSPDGSHVLFTSDKTGYASPYIARMPRDLAALPAAED